MLDAVFWATFLRVAAPIYLALVTENDGLLSLSLSSRGGEGTGKARYLQAREGLGQHARQSAHTFRQRTQRRLSSAAT